MIAHLGYNIFSVLGNIRQVVFCRNVKKDEKLTVMC